MDGLPAIGGMIHALEHLYRCLTKQSHGDGADALDAVFGDWPSVPDDFPIHNGSDTL